MFKNFKNIFIFYELSRTMSLTRAIFCMIFPPFAVYDKGCGSIIIVTALTVTGWIPGIIAALIICNKK